jgi:hypothetical protein
MFIELINFECSILPYNIPGDFHFPSQKICLRKKYFFEDFSISKNNCFEATKILQYCNLLNQFQNTFGLE